MPRRTAAHAQGGEALKAALFFVCEHRNRLTPGRAREIITYMLEIVGDPHRFKKFVAFVEDGPNAGDRFIPDDGYVLPGQAEFVKLERVTSVLGEKIEHEKPKYRRRGHKSYVPKALLTSDTCVLVIGSREFLGENAHLYLEEHGPLLKQLLKALKVFLQLEEACIAKRVDSTFYALDVFEKQFYDGNLNALWEQVVRGRRTTDELLSHLGNLRGFETADAESESHY